MTSFQDLKTNFWNRGTLVDSTHHWDYFKGLLWTMKQFMKQSDLPQFRSSLFQVKTLQRLRESHQPALISQGHKSSISSYLLESKETQVTEIQNEAF